MSPAFTTSWPRLTLGFVNCERGHYLKVALESVRACIEYPDLEWMVVHDNFAEAGPKDCLYRCEWISSKVFRRHTHADAMNPLVSRAPGEFILIWPEDVRFITRGDGLEDVIEVLRAYPDLGWVYQNVHRRSALDQREAGR